METIGKINQLESRQLELKTVMQKSDEHALKCAKLGISFADTYPHDFEAYEAARVEYNTNEGELSALYGQLEAEEAEGIMELQEAE